MIWTFWVAGIIVVLFIIKVWFGNGGCSRSPDSDGGCGSCGKLSDSESEALETLKQRFARGEIDEDTFEKMKDALSSDTKY